MQTLPTPSKKKSPHTPFLFKKIFSNLDLIYSFEVFATANRSMSFHKNTFSISRRLLHYFKMIPKYVIMKKRVSLNFGFMEKRNYAYKIFDNK